MPSRNGGHHRLSENEHMRGRVDPEPDRLHMPAYGIYLHSGGIGTLHDLSEQMLSVRNYWLGTTRPDERSHATRVQRSVTGTALVSVTMHPTGTGADRSAALDEGAIGDVHDVVGRGEQQCMT